jgi:hypothetical protein
MSAHGMSLLRPWAMIYSLDMIQRALLLYGAGSLSALAQALIGFGLSEAGVFALAHTTLTPGVSSASIYLKLVWGGLWALAALFPGMSRLRGWQAMLFLSLVPSVAQLLYFMPQSGAGWFGLAHGYGTPFVVLALNALWAALTLVLSNARRG